MSGPPLGHPWPVDVGQNPNINRDPPPPPIDAAPAPGAVPAGVPVAGQQQVHVQHHVPGLGLGMGMGAIPPPMMGVGVGMPMPFGPFFGGGFGGGFGLQSAGPLAPPRDPWNTPGLMGNPSTQYGAQVPFMPGMGFAPAALPPPPPGIVAGGAIPPFAPGAPLWMGGGGGGVIPGMGAGILGGGVGMPMGMGMGMMGGIGWGLNRPAPGMMAEAIDHPQPEQGDITQIAGGIPPGVTRVESQEHTIVIVIKGPIYPWLNHGQPMEMEAMAMGSSTGIGRLIEICNNNQESEGFAISECHEMTNGMWEKGQTFVYGDAMSNVLTIKDAGWDNRRNRAGGQSLHVFLHRV